MTDQKTATGVCDSLARGAGPGGVGESAARPQFDEGHAVITLPACVEPQATAAASSGSGGREVEDQKDLFRVGCHEAGHITASRFLDLEVAGATVAEGPGYSGLTWAPGSKRARRGKAAFDDDDDVTAVAVRVADKISKSMPGPGEPRSDDVFAAVQAETINLVAGGAAEMVVLGDAPPQFIASDMRSANTVAGIICHTPASRAAFIEHCYQEALAIIEQNKSVVLALARALIDHPQRTLNGIEIDEVIARALATRAAEAERNRRRDWQARTESAALLARERARRRVRHTRKLSVKPIHK
jgi:hypothetical protein